MNDTPMNDVTDIAAAERQRSAADPGASVWVSASAGTGKTKVLTDRVLSLLLAGTPPQKILCLTFTRAAAAEMAGRISDTLGEWSIVPDEKLRDAIQELTGTIPDRDVIRRARRLFVQVLDTPGGMTILTIHAFCQSLLRRFPLEAGIAPHFAVMENQRDTEELLVTAREEVLARARHGRDEALADAQRVISDHVSENQFADLFHAVAAERGRFARLIARHGGIDGAVARVYRRLGVAPGETPADVYAAASADDAVDQLGLRLAAEALSNGSKGDIERGTVIADWLAAPETRAAAFETYAAAYVTKSSLGQKTLDVRKTLITKGAAKDAPGAADILASEAARVVAVLMRARAAAVAEATAALIRVADALLDAYRRHKDARALLDYDDLILATGALLAREGVAPWVLYKLDGGIDHILIDEAQDTSPEQWHVIQALAEEFFAGESAREIDRTVFAVGDAKQSIYSFQGADPAAFAAMREMFAAKVAAAEKGWRAVDLTLSYRSVPAVLRAVDAVFAADDVARGVALDGAEIAHQASRSGDGGLVELWPPVEPRASDALPAWKPPVEQASGDSPQTRLAELIAKRIARMIETREVLESKGRPIEAGDIMVLVRRRTAFVEDLIRQLKTLGIGVAGIDRMILTEQLAVMDLIALGQFLILPEDDLTLATVLKGPIIGFTEEQLFDVAFARTATLWAALRAKAGDNPAYAAAAETLSELLARADYVPPFELFSEILAKRRGRERLTARLGPDAEDPIAEFLALAQAFERTHVPSLQGFLYWVAAGAVEIKRDLEVAPRDAVRVMTAHGAKGLQAPIVFLPDTLQAPTRVPPLLWPQDAKNAGGADEAVLWPPRAALYEAVSAAEGERLARARDEEYRRLLYVAMTRAEDRLYVCGWATKQAAPAHCWYNLIQAGLADIAEDCEDPFLAEAGETASAHVLRVTCRQTAEVEKGAEAGAKAALEELPPWVHRPPPPEPIPAEPLTPSRPDDAEPAVLSPLGPDDGARFRRGRLIHALLQTLPAIPAERRAAAADGYLHGSAPDLAAEARAEIAAETLAILSNPDFMALFGPDSQAEVPIVGRIGDQVISGQIDRLVVTPSEITIVDYKTNRPPPTRVEDVPALYLKQLAAYRAVLAEIYAETPVNCALLWTVGPHLMDVSGDLLAPYAP